MEPRKQRLMPWLHQKIEEGKTPGLFWADREQLIFQMPWVHAKKKSYDVARDAALYKSWAINSGKFIEDRDDPDPTTWKINFRCALNSLRGYVNLVKSDEIEGYRRMQFNRRALEEQLELDQARTIGRKILDQAGRRSSDGSLFRERAILRDLMDGCDAPWPNPMSMPGPMGGPRLSGDVTPPGPPRPISRSSSSLSSPGESDQLPQIRCQSRDSVGSSDSGLGKQRSGADEIEFIGNILDQLQGSSLEDARYDIDITIYYYNKEVARYRVANPRGCRIYYHPQVGSLMKLEPEEHERFLGGQHRTQIALPDPVFQTPALNRLLASMQRGLMMDMSNNDLFATQFGRCSVYCNDTRLETTDAGRLGRYEKTKVFDYRGLFKPHFETHCANRGGCPSTELFFTFGQLWHHSRPSEENLLSMSVIHTLARSQAQKRTSEVVNLRPTLELEISKPSSEDEYVNILLGNVQFPPSAMQSSLL